MYSLLSMAPPRFHERLFSSRDTLEPPRSTPVKGQKQRLSSRRHALPRREILVLRASTESEMRDGVKARFTLGLFLLLGVAGTSQALADCIDSGTEVD